VLPLDGGAHDLVLTRAFAASAPDVWGSLTDPRLTAGWFGTWTGEPGAGSHVRVQMGFEQDAPWSDVTIEVCEAPHHLGLSMLDDQGAPWRLEALLAEDEGVTTLTFVHHLDDVGGVGDIGPGWEYYLDMLVASRDGAALPAFEDYHPAQSAHFTDQLGTDQPG